MHFISFAAMAALILLTAPFGLTAAKYSVPLDSEELVGLWESNAGGLNSRIAIRADMTFSGTSLPSQIISNSFVGLDATSVVGERFDAVGTWALTGDAAPDQYVLRITTLDGSIQLKDFGYSADIWLTSEWFGFVRSIGYDIGDPDSPGDHYQYSRAASDTRPCCWWEDLKRR